MWARAIKKALKKPIFGLPKLKIPRLLRITNNVVYYSTFWPIYQLFRYFSGSNLLGSLNFIANVLIGVGLAILVLTYYPVAYQEIRYAINRAKVAQEKIDTRIAIEKGEFAVFYGKKEYRPVSKEFTLMIPKIDINQYVFRNVSSYNEKEYLEVLKKGLAHAKESSLPGKGVSFIFGHSTDNFYNITRYNAQFFLLNKMEKNDDIYVVLDGELYRYKVIDRKVIWPNEVPEIVNGYKNGEIVLQTCSPPGTVLKRLLVIGTPIIS